MDRLLICDIPYIRKNLQLLNGIKNWKRLMPFLKPLLRLFKVDTKQMEEALADIGELERLANDLASIPDDFNDLFSSRGWIIYDAMNLEIAKNAIAKAKTGNLDEAENDLVEYYCSENIDWKLMMMQGVKAFRPRMALAEKALIDYREERYHACVPVVLALLDGMVNELQEKRRGFFAEEANLEAWDSIAAHSKGLKALAQLFRKSRQTTTIEPISIPFRNGILHGMDLGYDNKMVAAKTWAALFATRDWALKAEQGLLGEQPEETKKSWGELFQQIHEHAREKAEFEKLFDEWSPRSLSPGEDFPVNGEPTEFTEGTPERALVEFLCFWKKCNYGKMVDFLLNWLKTTPGKDAGRVKNHYASSKLRIFEIKEIVDEAPAITEITVKLWYEEGQDVTKEVTFRLVNEGVDGNPTIRGKSGSQWHISNWGHGAL
ncbi:MAG: hypothetical protein JNK38_15330 [Acidobacteria bacterium]|nr:hypothetical protein [Acidobacteriota bacterium]